LAAVIGVTIFGLAVAMLMNSRVKAAYPLRVVILLPWAIPAVGFVGTVRGIGESLQQAHKAVEGDVSGVVSGLGTAFNATLVALSLSIFVMLCLHQMQLRQERAVLDTSDYLDAHLIRHLQVR